MRKCVICDKTLTWSHGQFCREHRGMDWLWILVDRGLRSDWPQSDQTLFPSHAEMQISPAWTLAPSGPMGAYIWQAELASILAWKGVRLDG